MQTEAVKRLLVGRPMASAQMDDTLLSKFLALPVFASDPLSSVAYATEAALVVLVGASATAGHLVFPVSIAISLLLAIVVISYTQTVRAYETSGGAYIVAKDNLGTLPSLVAGAALLTDYILTVAVSVAAGIVAITSAAPSLDPYRVWLCLACIVALTVANLRGVREAGWLFAIPTYGFVISLFAVIAGGVAKCATQGCPQATVSHPVAVGTGTVTIFVLLRAFASGSAALTGVESISNGVTAFKRPQSKNAAETLAIMGVIAITLFLGVSWLAVKMHARPSETTSVLSQIAHGVFPTGGFYYVVQGFTLAVLILAANSSYQGFPRLAALLARDRFFPRQFVNLGDRLVYSNGIVLVAGLASALIVIFAANVNSLLHLYVLGVFTAFTLSQYGMVRYWRRTRDRGWQWRAAVNGLGAATTLLVTLVVIETKFTEGAWAVTVAIPLMVAAFYATRKHYLRVGRRLRAGIGAVAAAPPATNEVVLFADSYDAALREAVWYARAISGDSFRAVSAPGRRSDPGLRARFRQLTDIRPDLELLPTSEGRAEAVIEYLWAMPHGESQFVTAIVPELFRRRSLVSALARHRLELSLKLRLLTEPGVVVTDVPVLAEGGDKPLPQRAVCRILVSGAHAATMRAVHYADTLGFEDTKAIFFAFDAEDAARMRREWRERKIPCELEIDEAPFRDLADPLMRHLRAITADPDAVAVVILPELIFRGWRRLLHNQRALYIKRLLLFEPRVILAAVPYRLN
ncbi:MAG TPA: APC family permease [Gaiellaceae bacterium]